MGQSHQKLVNLGHFVPSYHWRHAQGRSYSDTFSDSFIFGWWGKPISYASIEHNIILYVSGSYFEWISRQYPWGRHQPHEASWVRCPLRSGVGYGAKHRRCRCLDRKLQQWFCANFRGNETPSDMFRILIFEQFGEENRPCKLKRFVYGIARAKTMNDWIFSSILEQKLFGIMQQHSVNKPTLIFCPTRKGMC